jgi:hypothetical protein
MGTQKLFYHCEVSHSTGFPLGGNKKPFLIQSFIHQKFSYTYIPKRFPAVAELNFFHVVVTKCFNILAPICKAFDCFKF